MTDDPPPTTALPRRPRKPLLRRVATLVRWIVVALLVVAVLLLAFRAYDTRNGPPLQLWHKYVPSELSAAEIDRADWQAYVQHENALFADVRRNVTDRLPAEARIPSNRYFPGSPLYPGRFDHDWNRSYILRPAGPPVGAVVLLHGLTDSPYSLRHVAQRYVEHGFVAVGIRLPGHGTVPAALTRIDWETWMAATRLAVREARRLAGPDRPLDIVGYSNGSALALKYAMDAIENGRLARPRQLILLSPMVGITRYARFAGLAELPALLPAFAKAAWLGIVPEFNPFKYNSFPVNGARQSHRLTASLQTQIAALSRDGRLAALPPVLTFQSVADSTVSTPAILQALYAWLPANGSELVLFDVNRNAKPGVLVNPAALTALARMMPALPLRYRFTVIANSAGDARVSERVVEPGQTIARERPLALAYPPDVVSLSHVAVPFPPDDPLYGFAPAPTPDGQPKFGVELGALVVRAERGVLNVSLDSLFRIGSNPFFPYLLERLDGWIDRGAPRGIAGIAPEAGDVPVIPPLPREAPAAVPFDEIDPFSRGGDGDAMTP
ncbi:alpha-beta hydrolase superfamily lysophospholipase [Paraburkholderia caballeronis]|uniref:alpha/beta hydrolase n=1 Tax=Paraburkholderia caballeronis TaxID=416943 RepID=UPI0010662BC5|nr:alpha/beta hydrolase [Paraburkholderia caballeronis]TDV23486.1 alpha-beta hydrolase superfamily lysophospholipase [Paraburkholderia caballeronis]